LTTFISYSTKWTTTTIFIPLRAHGY